MTVSRFQALKNVTHHQVNYPKHSINSVTDIFGKNVFNLDSIRQKVSEEAYLAVAESIEKGKKIDSSVADAVATGMKLWAIENGCTHVTHWFQPMTGLTAEKHDAFFDFSENRKAIEKFTGEMLIQREPDASSFPSGGLRQTFEARGYTAWDPTSPAFIMELGGGKTLTIPSLFISYSGEALDKKTPLLRSIEALNTIAVEICQLFDKNVKRVNVTLGVEQEYFLIDRAFYQARLDLMSCGRTLFGATPAKGQQLEDHYFGSIKERAFAFMNDLEIEAYKLGIPLKTKHNEVAPHQFECAPIFEEANIANDHNLLLMDLMQKIALRHNLKVLLHEKPFAGVNGSGKHNNWALSTDTGKNILSPGKSPQENLQFLLFLSCILKALHDYPELIRMSIAGSGNDHRLGANEAPPAILSAFLGEQLDNVLNHIEKGNVNEGESNRQISFGISKIPDLKKDNTDRNRTSPFAFTGNKFEFRAVGSSANSALPIYILNTCLTQTLHEANDLIKKQLANGTDKRQAVLDLIRNYVKLTKKVRFEGNGYGQDWLKEAEKRKLPNITSSDKAFKILTDKKTIELFERYQVLNKSELISRYNVKLERFIKDIIIEANVAIRMCDTQILPALFRYQGELASSYIHLKQILSGKDALKTQKTLIEKLEKIAIGIQNELNALHKAIAQVETLEHTDLQKAAESCNNHIRPIMGLLRSHVDVLENNIKDEYWPLPKYSEMLFLM